MTDRKPTGEGSGGNDRGPGAGASGEAAERSGVRPWVGAVAALAAAGAVLAGLAVGGVFTGGRDRTSYVSPSPTGGGAACPASAPAEAGAELPLRYELAETYPSGLSALRGLALDGADRIYLAGDSAVVVLDPGGRPLRRWRTSGPARCVAVGASGNVYVGLSTRIEKYDPAGNLLLAWGEAGKGPGRLAEVVSIAVAEPDVYAADAGNRLVQRFAADGDFVLAIGGRDPEAGVPGLVCPSPFLDCAVDASGLIHVTNPGRLRVERYSADGRLLGWWGRAGLGPDGFPGCCNPTNIALLPDGSSAVSDKGVRRVRIFDAEGRVLAEMGRRLFGREGYESQTCEGPYGPGLDLAVDSSGRVLVIDPAAKAVRVFVRREAPSEAAGPAAGSPAAGEGDQVQ